MTEETGSKANNTDATPKVSRKKTTAKTPATKKIDTKKTASKAATRKPARSSKASSVGGGQSAVSRPAIKAAKAKSSAPKTSPSARTGESMVATPSSATQHEDTLESAKPQPRETASSATAQTHHHDEYQPGSGENREDPYSADRIASELKSKDWGDVLARAAFTLFYMFASWLAVVLGAGLTIIQFLVYLVTGKGNNVISRTILSIGHYLNQVALYVSFSSDERPFPFGKDLL
ncbi:DUF4389 domain-containing protein [Kordiimonas sp.]|uniref:DUF4389 domain-containing protein n=1 Tax=Kordiimonas sp. TaxID=1970157 RepID=UPI003A945C2E